MLSLCVVSLCFSILHRDYYSQLTRLYALAPLTAVDIYLVSWMSLCVAVGSTNPVKVQAVMSAFAKAFPHMRLHVKSMCVESGISSQPTTEWETQHGAVQRAREAASDPRSWCGYDAFFSVGIEGGVRRVETKGLDGSVCSTVECFAWVAVRFHDDSWGLSRTASMELPPVVSNLLREGMELGDAVDTIFRLHNSKAAGGAVGAFTGDILNRMELLEHASILALVPFLNTHHFDCCASVVPFTNANVRPCDCSSFLDSKWQVSDRSDTRLSTRILNLLNACYCIFVSKMKTWWKP